MKLESFLATLVVAGILLTGFAIADMAEERKKLIDAMKGKPPATVPEKAAVPLPKQTDCPKDPRTWKQSQLPMVFDDGYFYYGKLKLADYAVFGYACISCHKLKRPKANICDMQILHDGRWAWPQGELHVKHRREGCAGCHRLER